MADAKTEWERAWAARDYSKLRALAGAGVGKAMDLTDPLYYGDKALEAAGLPKVLQKAEGAVLGAPGVVPQAIAGAALPIVTGPLPGFGPADEVPHHEGWTAGQEADPTRGKNEPRDKYRERAYADRDQRLAERGDVTEMEKTSDATAAGKTLPKQGGQEKTAKLSSDEMDVEWGTEKFGDNDPTVVTEKGGGQTKAGDRMGRWDNPITESAPLRNQAQIEYMGPLSDLFDDEAEPTTNDRTQARVRKPGAEAAEKTEKLERTSPGTTRGQSMDVDEIMPGQASGSAKTSAGKAPSIGELLDQYAAGSVDENAVTEALSKPIKPDDADGLIKKLGGKGAKGVGSGIALAPIVIPLGGIAALAAATSSELGRMSRPDLSMITMSRLMGRPLTMADIGDPALKKALNSDPELVDFLVDGGFYSRPSYADKSQDVVDRYADAEMAPTPRREETKAKGKTSYASDRERALDEALGRLANDEPYMVQAGQYRGDGGYIYAVDDAGAVTIVEGPTGMGKKLTSGTAYDAILNEIRKKNKDYGKQPAADPSPGGSSGASYEGF